MIELPDPVLARLLPRFVERRRRDVATILDMLEQNRFDRLLSIGHNLKGTGRTYGCDGITDIGRALEQAARDGDAAEVRRQAAALDDYVRRFNR